jgi:hypothetical protein
MWFTFGSLVLHDEITEWSIKETQPPVFYRKPQYSGVSAAVYKDIFGSDLGLQLFRFWRLR